MKRFAIVAGILFFGMLASTQIVHGQAEPKESADIAVNGGFEEWREATEQEKKTVDCVQFPAGWMMIGSSCVLVRDDKAKHGGSSSLRAENKDTRSTVSVVQRMDAAPETRYRFKMWLKGENIDSYQSKGVILHVMASGTDDKKDTGLWTGKLNYEWKVPSPNSGTFDWKEFVFTFDTQPQTRTIMLYVQLRGAGMLWLDDVEVLEMEKIIKVESY
ncbi:MAG: carbohydrate binding domain-containing protein [Victivallales bacterium]